MLDAIRRIFGGSQPTRPIEVSLVDMVNNNVKEASMDTTICLSPLIINGNQLKFFASDELKNKAGAKGAGSVAGVTSNYNLLGRIRDTINVDQHECIVIMSISRVHVHNELDGTFHFNMNNVFDFDSETQRIRDKIDMALELDDAQKITIAHGNNNNNNNNVATKRGGMESVVILESPIVPEPEINKIIESTPIVTPEDILRQAQDMNVRGRHTHRNAAESTNVISVGEIPANSTSCVHRTLYRASISHKFVQWFAGQDEIIQTPSSYAYLNPVCDPEMDSATRGAKPIKNSMIYEETHQLVIFIKMFADALSVKDGEMTLMKGNRDDTERWIQINRNLVDRARNMVLYVVYAQMYYTTLRNCTFERIIVDDNDDSNLSERALVLKLASRYGLRVDPITKHVSDWGPGAYRPQIVITLHVEYYIVPKSTSSAACINKQMTSLSKTSK